MLLQNDNELLPEDRLQFFRERATRRNKRSRIDTKKRKIQKLYDKTKTLYGTGAYYDALKKRFVRYSVNNASIRTLCNRRFRHNLKSGKYETVADGGAYRKHEDYWWIVF